MTSTDAPWFEGPNHSAIDTALRNAAELWDALYFHAHTNGDVLRLCLEVIAELSEAARQAALQSRLAPKPDQREH
ncbi:hypothetical protein [Mycolicibacterium llatzerense]|uniref:hypothetical protein n=1 Tax=Mycolicibacterium llatzerense TaxID=280871 RepID=UPI0031E2B2E4